MAFGSATLKGAATYFSKEFMANPAMFRKEYEELEKEFLGDPDKKTGIYAEHKNTAKLTAFMSEE